MFSRKESAHGWCYLITNYILTGERDSNEGILIRQLLSFSQVTMLKLNQLLPPPPILIFLFFVSLLYLLHLPSIFALASYYLGYFHYCCSSLRQLLDHVYLGYCLFKHVHSKTIFFSQFHVVVEFAFFSASSLSLP